MYNRAGNFFLLPAWLTGWPPPQKKNRLWNGICWTIALLLFNHNNGGRCLWKTSWVSYYLISTDIGLFRQGNSFFFWKVGKWLKIKHKYDVIFILLTLLHYFKGRGSFAPPNWNWAFCVCYFKIVFFFFWKLMIIMK